MKQRILIVEDEAPIRRVMAMALESEYDVVVAEDGPAGLAQFGDGSNWQAVLLDQRMPGMEGLEVLRRMKEIDPAVPVVMITAYPSIDLAVDAMKIGATDFLRKPVTPDILRSAVKAAISPVGRPLTGRRSDRPDIEMITMNGFRIVEDGATGWNFNFRVFEGAGATGSLITVAITADAAARVQQLVGRHFDAGSSYWQVLAEGLLAAALWRDQRLPESPMVIRDVSAQDLEAASFWLE